LPLTRDQIGDQPFARRFWILDFRFWILNFFPCHDYSLAYRGMLTEDGLDLFRLDSEAANLELAIGPTDKLDIAIG
jgi:hypothetical protein